MTFKEYYSKIINNIYGNNYYIEEPLTDLCGIDSYPILYLSLYVDNLQTKDLELLTNMKIYGLYLYSKNPIHIVDNSFLNFTKRMKNLKILSINNITSDFEFIRDLKLYSLELNMCIIKDFSFLKNINIYSLQINSVIDYSILCGSEIRTLKIKNDIKIDCDFVLDIIGLKSLTLEDTKYSYESLDKFKNILKRKRCINKLL